MASSSHFNNDVEDAAPPSSPRLSPALITDFQALPESDPRDGQATSWTSEDGDLVVLTEKQAGKRLQSEQGKSAETDLSAASVTNAELAALIAALKQTTEALQGQNRRMDEQNLRLDRLERNQRFSRNNSPPRRTPTSPSPPRQETVRQRRPALERIEQPGRKRDHVSPPREGISSPNVKKGKIVDRTPPRRHSPQGLSLMTKQGQPVSRSHHTDQFSRSPTPDREGSPPLNSQESDEDDPRCPLSHDILQAPVPKGCERPPPLPAYDGLTDPDEHIASVNATLNFLRVSGAIRCRIFPTTLRKGAMAWYHSLAPRSITSWMDLSDQFRRHFTASRKQPKTEAVLDAIFQADNESLRSFIERFNKEAVQRGNAPRAEAAETSNNEEAAPEKSGHKPVALAISRTEDFFVPDYLDDTYVAPTLSKWDALAHAMVISGGGFDKQTVGSIKRKFEELIDGSSNLSATLDKPKGQSKPLAFYMEELPGGTANSQIPLLIRVDMANMDVRRGPELRYQQIEKIALALVYAARRLRHYFLAHTIVVRTDQPIKSLLGRPDMAGRMLKWSLELSEFDIRYESRKALKAQVLADFVAEMTSSSPTVDEADKWTIFVDGASSATGAGAGIILENENGLLIEVSLALSFPTSNNQAEYEAFLAGLRLAEDLQAKEIKIYTDSQLVASQVLGEYQTKNDNLSEYLVLVKEKITKFNSVEILHVPREHNKRADILSKLASTKRKGGNKSVIQEILPRPSIEKPSKVVDINVIGDKDCWMTPVYNFLEHGTLPDDQKQAAVVRRRACSYVILDGKLYRRGFSIPLLKCVDEDTADYILREVHEGINAQHLGGRSLARKALRAGYYWPTMQQDAKDHVKKCDKCQRHGDMHLAPPRELKSLSSPWPFAWWGMDLLGPFTKGLYQNRYLIVAVDYFTKWVEAEPLSDITSLRVLRFFKRNVLARFGIPQVVVTDNGTQFTDKEFQAFLVALGTKQHFTSVEHPQTNGQAEAANRVILRGLRRRLDQNKKKWVEELDNVLWAYRTTPHSTTGETPFRMVYGTEAVIPVEIGEPSRRTEQPLDEEQNDEALREELDLVEEIRTGASLKEATLKQKIAARHDTKVIKREFEVGSLVLRRNADSQDGKLAPNWEGPYRVIDKTENGAYYLEDLRGKKLPRPWNAQKLKQYYS
ncbi:unnamed protein product [Trifolium pratense]|uniref:Uncharacterized protein n=1 Tax=Trifolium pratense TaxID=57577 RepID=A0ACB0K3X2_TRIPR|nr:unnamed protein product [Trifolium pratense]